MPLDELRDAGFVLEANRRFFHPLGLALGVRFDEQGEPVELIVIDYREDPEGMLFESLHEAGDAEKHQNVQRLWDQKAAVRQERFGWVIQPMGSQLGTSEPGGSDG
jgi:hypothetical protein